MSTQKRKVAVVTGASSGLGEEYSKQLAKLARQLSPQVDELWVIARRHDRLISLQEQLHPFPVRIFSGDLNLESTLQSLEIALHEGFSEVTWLVNNAGFGLVGQFTELDRKRQLEMIDLNVRALTDLTYRVLPFMPRGSRLVLVASSAGFFPLPNFAVYAATKAYVVSFANALASELLPRGISCTAVCPGPVTTEFFSQASKSGQSPKGVPQASPLDVVSKSLKDAQKNRLRSTFGGFFNLMILLSGITPREILRSPLAGLIKKSTD